MHAQLPSTAILHSYGSKNLSKNRAGPCTCTGSGEARESIHVLGQT